MTTCCYAILGYGMQYKMTDFMKVGRKEKECHSHQFFIILFLSLIKKDMPLNYLLHIHCWVGF